VSFDWSRFAGGAGGAFVKFDEIGDSVTGHVVAIRTHTFDPKKGEVPLIDLEKDDGENVTLSVDKVDLAMQIPALNPQVGDKLRVKYVANEKTPNGTKKCFEIQHKAGDRAPVVEEAPPEYSDEPF
jgi:hypothetical protein